MSELKKKDWKQKIISPEEVLQKIKPGMSIFLGTGNTEPRTLVKALLDSDATNLQDLALPSQAWRSK